MGDHWYCLCASHHLNQKLGWRKQRSSDEKIAEDCKGGDLIDPVYGPAKLKRPKRPNRRVVTVLRGSDANIYIEPLCRMTSGQEWRLGIGISSSGTITTLGQSDFDQRFAASSFKIIRRTCPNCDNDFQDIYYRRRGTSQTWRVVSSTVQ